MIQCGEIREKILISEEEGPGRAGLFPSLEHQNFLGTQPVLSWSHVHDGEKGDLLPLPCYSYRHGIYPSVPESRNASTPRQRVPPQWADGSLVPEFVMESERRNRKLIVARAEYEDECLCPISDACFNHGRVVMIDRPGLALIRLQSRATCTDTRAASPMAPRNTYRTDTL